MINEKTVTTTSYIASGGVVFAGLTLNEIGILVGIITAIITVVVHVWYHIFKRIRSERRERAEEQERMVREMRAREEHALKMELLRRQLRGDGEGV